MVPFPNGNGVDKGGIKMATSSTSTSVIGTRKRLEKLQNIDQVCSRPAHKLKKHNDWTATFILMALALDIPLINFGMC